MTAPRSHQRLAGNRYDVALHGLFAVLDATKQHLTGDEGPAVSLERREEAQAMLFQHVHDRHDPHLPAVLEFYIDACERVWEDARTWCEVVREIHNRALLIGDDLRSAQDLIQSSGELQVFVFEGLRHDPDRDTTRKLVDALVVLHGSMYEAVVRVWPHVRAVEHDVGAKDLANACRSITDFQVPTSGSPADLRNQVEGVLALDGSSPSALSDVAAAVVTWQLEAGGSLEEVVGLVHHAEEALHDAENQLQLARGMKTKLELRAEEPSSDHELSSEGSSSDISEDWEELVISIPLLFDPRVEFLPAVVPAPSLLLDAERTAAVWDRRRLADEYNSGVALLSKAINDEGDAVSPCRQLLRTSQEVIQHHQKYLLALGSSFEQLSELKNRAEELLEGLAELIETARALITALREMTTAPLSAPDVAARQESARIVQQLDDVVVMTTYLDDVMKGRGNRLLHFENELHPHWRDHFSKLATMEMFDGGARGITSTQIDAIRAEQVRHAAAFVKEMSGFSSEWVVGMHAQIAVNLEELNTDFVESGRITALMRDQHARLQNSLPD